MKYDIQNILSYIQGHVRYKLYYSVFKFLIRKHIKEQINYRIDAMEIKCYLNGSCIMCGCKTLHLQMANKACDKPCYPSMLSKKKWKEFKIKGTYIEKDYMWYIVNKQFKKVKYVMGK